MASDLVDPHIHLFNLKGTPRPMQPLGKMFGWNDKLLRAAATKLMPADTIAYFGKETKLLGDYMPSHYRSDSTSSGIGRYVHIQAGWSEKTPMDPVGETAWLEGLEDGPAGIVAHADLSMGSGVARVLKAHREASSRVRGIRHMLSWHPNKMVMDFAHEPELSRTSAFREGFDQLAEHGLSYDAWCYSEQLPEVAELAASNPDVPVVLCHVGTPIGWGGEFHGIGASRQARNRIDREWRDNIEEVAAQSHVHCKLSGLLMPVVGFGYDRHPMKPNVIELVDRLSPLVEHCIAAFGPERCMFASNFPVDQISAPYDTVHDAMAQIMTRHGEAAKHQMLAGTAASFYRI